MSKLLSAAAAIFVVMIFALPAIAQVAAAPPPTQSQVQEVSPEKRALILELLEITNTGQSAEQMLDVMSEQLEKHRVEVTWEYLQDTDKLTDGEKANLRDEIAASTARAGKKFRERLNQRMNYGKLIEEITLELYAKYYDANELQDLVNFYKSPTGKKSLEIMATLVGESMNRASERLDPVIKDISKEIAKDEAISFQKRVDDMVKSHHRPATKTGRRPGA